MYWDWPGWRITKTWRRMSARDDIKLQKKTDYVTEIFYCYNKPLFIKIYTRNTKRTVHMGLFTFIGMISPYIHHVISSMHLWC